MKFVDKMNYKTRKKQLWNRFLYLVGLRNKVWNRYWGFGYYLCRPTLNRIHEAVNRVARQRWFLEEQDLKSKWLIQYQYNQDKKKLDDLLDSLGDP